MEVILLERIHNLGKLGDKVRVKPGYGRNYLVPRKKAVPATADNVARFEAQRAELEKAQAEGLARATLRADAMRELELTIVGQAVSMARWALARFVTRWLQPVARWTAGRFAWPTARCAATGATWWRSRCTPTSTFRLPSSLPVRKVGRPLKAEAACRGPSTR